LELQTPGVYSIPYKCGQIHSEQTGWSTETRGKENLQKIWLGQHKSLVAENTFNNQHHIHLPETKTLFHKTSTGAG